MASREWYSSETKEIATNRAKKLQQRLNKSTGGKWKIRVHENLGWHYSVNCGSISVSQYGTKNYSCLMSDGQYAGTGAGIWSYPTGMETPEEAIQVQLQEAYNVTKRIVGAVESTRKKLPNIQITE